MIRLFGGECGSQSGCFIKIEKVGVAPVFAESAVK